MTKPLCYLSVNLLELAGINASRDFTYGMRRDHVLVRSANEGTGIWCERTAIETDSRFGIILPSEIDHMDPQHIVLHRLCCLAGTKKPKHKSDSIDQRQ